jgi:predicted nucleic acid-binding protein
MTRTAADAREPSGLLLDTSVLISAVDRSRSDHRTARALIERQPRLWLCAQTCREFLAVSTRPMGSNGLGMPCRQACDNLELLRQRIRTLPEERPLLATLLGLIAHYGLVGRAIHDAGIVAAACAHRLDGLVTSDLQIFTRYQDTIPVLSPQQARARQKRPSTPAKNERGVLV